MTKSSYCRKSKKEKAERTQGELEMHLKSMSETFGQMRDFYVSEFLTPGDTLALNFNREVRSPSGIWSLSIGLQSSNVKAKENTGQNQNQKSC